MLSNPTSPKRSAPARSRGFTSLITENGGEIGETNDWGKRTLAYEIRHYSEGHYGLTTFRLPSQSVESLKDRLNIDEDILRFQVVARAE